MRIPHNKYIAVPVYSLFLVLMVFLLAAPPVFSQGKEFIRLRSTQYGTPPTIDSLTDNASTAEYYMAPGDVIDIYVWNNPDVSREATIRGDGKISYPLIGTFKAAGLSIDQLQDLIREKLSVYIVSPQVIVTLRSSAGNKIIVLGQVGYPGIFTFKGNNLSLIEAVAMAGDFTPDGRRESVMIISDNLTMNPKVRRVNALKAIREGIKTKDVMLQPNDVVYVPRSTIADFNKFLTEIQPTMTTLSTFFGLGQSGQSFAQSTNSWFFHRDWKVIHQD